MEIMEWMIPLIAGVGFLTYGFFLLYNVCIIWKTGVNTQAQVVELLSFRVHRRGQRAGRLPMFQYKVDNQQVKSLGVNAVKLSGKYEVGDSVRIRYNPKHPEKFIIPNNVGKELIIICIAIGAILVATFINYL